MKNIFKYVFGILSILGCIMGAGLVSGAEIYTFFAQFKIYGVVGLVICSIGFGICIYLLGKKQQTINKNKYNFLPYCQAVIAGTMMAGLIETLQIWGIPKPILLLVLSIIVFVCLVIGVGSANFINVTASLGVICLLPFIIKSCKSELVYIVEPASSVYIISSVVYAFMYIAMNLVAAEVVINATTYKIKHKKIFSVLCAIAIFIVLFVFYGIILFSKNKDNMPMLGLIKNNKAL